MITCPKCKHRFIKQKVGKMTLNNLKLINRLFKERQNPKSVKVITEILKEIKHNSGHGLTIDQFCEVIDELNGFTKKSVDIIADYCQYRIKDIGSKHVNYFRQVIRSKVTEPQIIYKTERMRVN